MFTRKQYMAGEVSHQDYYFQFGQHLVGLVSMTIGEERIRKSQDPGFNDIPLHLWDSLAMTVGSIVGRKLAEANESKGFSLSDCVCAAKSAARHIRDN